MQTLPSGYTASNGTGYHGWASARAIEDAAESPLKRENRSHTGESDSSRNHIRAPHRSGATYPT